VAVGHPRGDVLQVGERRVGEDDVVPCRAGLDPAGEPLEAHVVLLTGAGREVTGVEVDPFGQRTGPAGRERAAVLVRAEPERGQRRLGLVGDHVDRRVRGHEVDDERGRIRPGGVAHAGPGQHHRPGAVGETADGPRLEIVDRSDDERPAQQPRFPEGRLGDTREVVGGPHAREVDDEVPAGERPDRDAERAQVAPLPEVGDRDARGPRPGQLGGLRRRDRRRRPHEVVEGAVALVVAEQVGGDPVGDPQRAGEERPLGLLDGDQAVPDERHRRGEPAPRAGVEQSGAGER
jgi:hypothetical protein